MTQSIDRPRSSPVAFSILTLLTLATAGSDAVFAQGPLDPFQREGRGASRVLKDGLEGKAPPPLRVSSWMNTNGKALGWSDLRGQVVLIDFWGVWCAPCRRALPHLQDLHERYREQGLVVIGVHTRKQGEKMKSFVEESKLTYPIALDREGKTVATYRVDGFPDYYLIDRSGKLRVADLANANVDTAVRALLAEPAPESAKEAKPKDGPKPDGA